MMNVSYDFGLIIALRGLQVILLIFFLSCLIFFYYYKEDDNKMYYIFIYLCDY